MAIEEREMTTETDQTEITHDWNMVGIENGANPVSYGRDWRYILMGEAMSRATMADATALHRACETPPRSRSWYSLPTWRLPFALKASRLQWPLPRRSGPCPRYQRVSATWMRRSQRS